MEIGQEKIKNIFRKLILAVSKNIFFVSLIIIFFIIIFSLSLLLEYHYLLNKIEKEFFGSPFSLDSSYYHKVKNDWLKNKKKLESIRNKKIKNIFFKNIPSSPDTKKRERK